MTENNDEQQNISVSVPIGVIASGAVLGLAAAAAYLLLGRNGDSSSTEPSQGSRVGKGMGRKLGLMTLITLIENDMTRRLVIQVLKAIARRS